MLRRLAKRSVLATIPRRIGVLWPVLALGVLAKATPLGAVELLTVDELVSHCRHLDANKEGADAQYCVRYIQGFIDGAAATDVRVMLNSEADSQREESFTERALRTRAPTRAEHFRAARLAGFCLGDRLSLREVVDVVVAELIDLDVDDTYRSPARDAVYSALQHHYPCADE